MFKALAKSIANISFGMISLLLHSHVIGILEQKGKPDLEEQSYSDGQRESFRELKISSYSVTWMYSVFSTRGVRNCDIEYFTIFMKIEEDKFLQTY